MTFSSWDVRVDKGSLRTHIQRLKNVKSPGDTACCVVFRIAISSLAVHWCNKSYHIHIYIYVPYIDYLVIWLYITIYLFIWRSKFLPAFQRHKCHVDAKKCRWQTCAMVQLFVGWWTWWTCLMRFINCKRPVVNFCNSPPIPSVAIQSIKCSSNWKIP